MIYILKQGGRIVGFGESPFVLAENQTQANFDGTLADYAGRFKLAANKATITADGVDEAIVTVASNTGAGSVNVTVNGVLVTVNLVNGVGTLPAITSEVAGIIQVKPADETVYSAAGEGSLVIQAV